MILNYLLAIAVILSLLVGWCGIQYFARRYAQHHPELGAAREEGSGCGSCNQCHEDSVPDQ